MCVLSASAEEILALVKRFINVGICKSVITDSRCGSSARPFYKEIIYNKKRVIISSNVPDHDAEHDMLHINPNTRCERWQYVQLPLSPTKVSHPVKLLKLW